MNDFIATLCERIKAAHAAATPLVIHGGNSKKFYGGTIVGDAIDMRSNSGIIDYEPRELVLTVRAGTTMTQIDATLAAQNQMLPFEPPHFDQGATIGGTVATGLSGSRRPYAGAVRDFVLGTRVVNGKGEDLQFGGRVIKNVAGYDVSRLMTGAMGTLGVLTEISFKVLPIPASEVSLQFSLDEATAIQRFNQWAGRPLPLGGAAWHAGIATVRLSGTHAGVAAAVSTLGGERLDDVAARTFWQRLREQQHDFFQFDKPLWRISVPTTTAPLILDTPAFIDWGGGLRWLKSDMPASELRARVALAGGHATLFRAATKNVPVFHPLTGKLAELNRNLKTAFDPANILNRGRMDNI